jgi:hypothetical protein
MMDKDDDSPEKTPVDRDPVFYYSRSRRLERASEAVRAINDPSVPKWSAIKNPRARLLSLIFLALMIFIVGIISFVWSPADNAKNLGGNTVAVSALTFQGAAYLVIKKSVAEKDGAYTGTVDLAVSRELSPEEEKNGVEAPIVTHRIFFSLEPEEEYRFSVPFEADRLVILMQGGKDMISLSVKPE